ncbi:UvrD-helicase domain-containing protein [Pectobacterium aquaticum]|uniref:UvrD-helicase domain-containing protein n=1 Tax=Dickeya dadantii TaxID=204038 RepID=UPI0019699894|nr:MULTISPECIES: UvrD-helicase domain-containing protein [Pectobacteriaceae]MBN3066193.1 UvrD-helicase domain-containing protein [Pectobacterium aquaticum]MCA7012476.1 UvrD-helicase domain-containing protein [Dickeya dadantii]
MSAVHLSPDDLVELTTLARDLNFDDAERRSALLENGSRDFNAVPGSGKTSLLAAKLLLLARKWPHARRGICVLSHTNVARDEIAHRLAGTVEGAQLLSYPHFIGTIHSFVNHFFAMPLLRSLGEKIDVIDDQVFADKARSLLLTRKFSGLRIYLENQRNGEGIATTLFYRTAALSVHVESGSLPASHTKSYNSLIELKNMLACQGIFRHRDMFAFADLALQTCPRLLDVVHRRFPMVFIDEMQDTSWDQESLLNRIFDGRSVMQRFGDIDQKIISDEEQAELLTFPRAGYGCISTSKRFGKSISDAVGCVRVSGEAVVGEAENVHAPVLLLYKTNAAIKVVERFGQIVIDQLSEDNIGVREVKAMSARKTGESNVDAGRHLLDYYPTYGGDKLSAGIRSESFWSLVGDSKGTLKETSLSSRVSDVRRALLLVLRASGASLAQDIRDARALPRAANAVTPTGTIDKLTRQLALSGEELCSDGQRDVLIALLYTQLKPYIPEELILEKFKGLSIFEDVGERGMLNTSASARCKISFQGRSLDIGLGTIAGMKGETHAASLILESYGGSSRKFDVALGLEYIAGISIKNISKLPKTQQAQMRNLYVAMSRPTKLLCLAANESRVSQALRDALLIKGWHIEEVD